MMHHLLEVAKIEMENIAEQKSKRLKALTSGYDHALYNQNPELRKDLESAAGAAGEQFTYDDGAGVKAGTVEGGYEFVGGDPSDPKNWKEVGK
jgi:hypothetical protein